jgi:hypothetical protein
MRDLRPITGDTLALVEVEAAKAYGRAAKSASTRREYARDWTAFAAWCAERGLASLPASPHPWRATSGPSPLASRSPASVVG